MVDDEQSAAQAAAEGVSDGSSRRRQHDERGGRGGDDVAAAGGTRAGGRPQGNLGHELNESGTNEKGQSYGQCYGKYIMMKARQKTIESTSWVFFYLKKNIRGLQP